MGVAEEVWRYPLWAKRSPPFRLDDFEWVSTPCGLAEGVRSTAAPEHSEPSSSLVTRLTSVSLNRSAR